MSFRAVGFTRGGRSTAAVGVPGDPLSYYFGGTGGGVFKTSDAGHNWTNVSDGFFGVGAVGAIAVAPSDVNVVYVGTGSTCPRGNISVGDGMYRSTDAGKTWTHVGLRHAGQIGAIAVHPDNPDVAYAAALGYIFGTNEDRGIFRTKDGGATWEKVFFLSDRTGFVDIQMDPNNPRILYAGALARGEEALDHDFGERGRRHLSEQGWRRHLGQSGGRSADRNGREDGHRDLARELGPHLGARRGGRRRGRPLPLRRRAGRAGAASTTTPTCASAPGTTSTSTRIRRTKTPSTA